jgi:REP element-mobilizing transposase RayT
MPDRKHLRRLDQTWARCPRYFLTLCIAHRRRILAAPQTARILTESWRAAPQIHEWAVGRYVVMPDHVHFFAAALSDKKSLSSFIRDWKKWTTRQFQVSGITSPPAWQPEFFDHVLRSAESYEEKWNYVRENPVRAGLVPSAEEWPYSGECTLLHF